MQAKLWFTLKNPPSLLPTKHVNRTTLICASHQLGIAGVLCHCLSDGGGKPQSSLMWLSALQPGLSVLKPSRHKMERCTRDAQCSLPRKPRARLRHPIKALGTPRCELSQLGFVWAQIFEHCSTARVPLAGHHRLSRPKQKFGGRVEGWRCGWRGGVNVGNVHNACLCSVFLLPVPKLSDGLYKV